MSNVNFDFTDKKYVITGASSGMGKQVAMELAQAGAMVLAIARKNEPLLALQSEYPNNIVPASVDVCDKEALQKAICDFVTTYGKINGCDHAAGISDITPIKSYDKEVAQKIMNISFWAGMDLIQLTTKAKYAEQGSSNIIFSSVGAFSCERGMFVYSAAKAAINAAVKSVAKEISGKKHRVNSIVPGWVKSPMTEQAGILADTESFFNRHLLGAGEAQNVSGVVLFLLSDRASWITGTNLVVDGGYLA